MFERLKRAVVKDGEKMTPFKAFLLGAASKTLATVVRPFLSPLYVLVLTFPLIQVTYPYIMAKTRLQAGGGDDDEDEDEKDAAYVVDGKKLKTKKKERYDGAIDCLKQVYQEEGIVGWYQVRPFLAFR